jgi:RNA polymerase sigma-70 factor (ECF subfamily)
VLTIAEPREEEAALVRAAQGGDRAAFGVLYQQYEHLVHGILISLVSYQEAEDLMQDVFVKAIERLSSLRDPCAFSGWLMVITRHTATDHQRNKKPEVEVREEVGGRTAPDARALSVMSTIRSLPECYRETLTLRLVEGMTGPEIATQTGLTPDSVRVNLCRGMKLLRASLEGR